MGLSILWALSTEFLLWTDIKRFIGREACTDKES
jgi:hypothetical protein